MKVSGLVFHSPRYWTPYGAAQPADAWPDYSCHANDGSFKGAGEPDWVQLPSGLWVMSFDGTDDYIQVSASPSISLGNGSSLTYWCKVITYTQYRRIWGKYVDVNNEIGCYQDTNKLVVQVRSGGVTSAYLEATMVTGSWAFYAVTFNAAGNMAIHYYNATVGGAGTDTIYTMPNSNGADLYIGGRGGGSSFSNTQIALFDIYSYALSADQVNKIYQKQRHLFGV